MHIIAVNKGLASDTNEAVTKRITDQSWSNDFGKLYEVICPEAEQIGRSSLFGSRPPANDSLWGLAKREGFEVVVFDRNYSSEEKEVDVAIATRMAAVNDGLGLTPW